MSRWQQYQGLFGSLIGVVIVLLILALIPIAIGHGPRFHYEQTVEIVGGFERNHYAIVIGVRDGWLWREYDLAVERKYINESTERYWARMKDNSRPPSEPIFRRVAESDLIVPCDVKLMIDEQHQVVRVSR